MIYIGGGGRMEADSAEADSAEEEGEEVEEEEVEEEEEEEEGGFLSPRFFLFCVVWRRGSRKGEVMKITLLCVHFCRCNITGHWVNIHIFYPPVLSRVSALIEEPQMQTQHIVTLK